MEHLEQNKYLPKLNSGDHICLLFDHMDYYRDVATKFIADGLLNNEKVLCIINEYPMELLNKDLKKKNIDVEHFIENGQLIITSNRNVYYASNNFDPVKTVEYWRRKLSVMQKGQFNGVRAIGEMIFAADGKEESFDKLIEYQFLFNKEIMSLYDNHMYLCAFNKSKFPNFVLEDMIKKHSVVIHNEELFSPNPCYIDLDSQIKEYNEKKYLRNLYSLDTNNDSKIDIDNEKECKNINILKHVLGATGDGVWELDIESSKLNFSDTFYDIVGQTNEDTTRDYKEMISLIHPEDYNEFVELTKCCLNGEFEYFNSEVRVKRSSGDWAWILIKGVPLIKDVANGQILKMVGIFNNITESKKIKRELDEKIYFEKLRTDFFANLSHEFRTPLNVILGSIQLQELYANNNSINDNADRYRRTLKSMKLNCYRLLRLINNFIDITKIESGFYNLELENYDIVNLIKNIVTSVEDYVTKQKLSIEFNNTINSLVIACDPEKIERVMLNLLSNAIKFTECGGKITVEISSSNEYVEILIEDNGLGIPDDKLNSIFDRFSQVDKSLTRNHEGSGIGLSLVKSIVEIHGGEVYAESKLNKGSKFVVKLPIVAIDEDSKYKKKLDDVCIKNVEIMHVEFADIYSRE